MSDKKARFLKVYSQLPESLIDQIVVVVDGKPYSWKAIYFEVKNNTNTSKKILNTLFDMRIIQLVIKKKSHMLFFSFSMILI